MTESAVLSGVPESTPQTAIYLRAFGALIARDGRVMVRQFADFLTRTVLTPLLFVFVFTYVLPRVGQGIGGGGPSFATVLLPGLVAMAILFQGIMSIGLGLTLELGRTGELRDRIMAPLPTGWVAMEKVLFCSFQGLLAAAIVFPLVYVIPATSVSVHVASWPMFVSVLVLSCVSSAAVGLAIGTMVPAKHIQLTFGVMITPMIFLGCVFYPWQALEHIAWLQIAVLANPLVYISEGLRQVLTPDVPHMPTWGTLAVLVLGTLALLTFGTRAFVRRVRL